MSEDIDPREYIVPASDGKGHSDRVWLRIQSGHDRQMSMVLNSKFFPYRSKGDLIRHAIVRHLRWLEDQNPVSSVTAQVDSILEMMREEEFNAEFKEVISRLEEQVSHYLASSQVGRAKSLVARVLSKVEMMPDSEWKDQYKKQITDKYSSLVTGLPVNLMGTEE